MYGYYSFPIRRSEVNGVTLAIFCATARAEFDEVITVLADYCHSNFSPDAVLLIGLSPDQESLEKIASNSRLTTLLPSITRSSLTPKFSVRVIPRSGLKDGACAGSLKWKDIRLAGLKQIFLSRRAVLVAPGTHHFEKPSKQHCSRFIRTANSLVDGAEIFFIATCCLPHIDESVKHFYLDTGGVSVLAFALNSVRRRFDPNSFPATVNTFESYQGLGAFEFRDVQDSVVILSASTSSALEREVLKVEPRLTSAQILTIFGSGTAAQSSVIFDIRADSDCSEAMGPHEAFRAEDCPLCKKGSIAVPMISDQFIPVRSNCERVMLTKKSAPDWLRRSVSLFATVGILKANFEYQSSPSQQKSKEVYFDLHSLEDQSSLRIYERIERAFVQSIPASVKRIVHLSDSDSARIAHRWRDRIESMRGAGSTIEVVSTKQLVDCTRLSDGATVVVASAVANGNSLRNTSRILRDMQTNGAVSYIIAIARLHSNAALEKLIKDLRMRELGSDYSVCVGESVTLPQRLPNRKSSWDDECSFLLDIAESCTTVRPLLEDRIQQIQQSQSQTVRGLHNNLFWTDQSGRKLHLSPGFVFFPESFDVTNVSQADLFFAVMAVLHHNRWENGARPPLRQTEYTRKILCPLMFDRFNDGAIQAAILRACTEPELDYSFDESASRDMRMILERIVSEDNANNSTALREFVLALALHKLRLATEDIASIKRTLAQANDPFAIAFSQHL